MDPVFERIRRAAQVDDTMIALRETILRGFPNSKNDLQPTLKPFWAMRCQLAIDDRDDMIVAGLRIVVPEACRRKLLQDLVQMHQGTTKLRQRARLTLYWPGMDRDVETVAQSCKSCTESMPSNPPEPLRPHEPATRPFEQVHADFATFNGRNLLILVGPNRDYLVKTPAGRLFRRYRRLLRHRTPVMPGDADPVVPPAKQPHENLQAGQRTWRKKSKRPSTVTPRRSERTKNPVQRFVAE